MIRTNVVKLTVIEGIAFRQKLPSGGSGITILRPDCKQPGIASISKTSGEAIPSANTNKKMYPQKAFKEAMELTKGMAFKKQGNVKITDDMFPKKVEEPEVEEEIVLVDMRDYRAIVDHYSDSKGKLSYDLMNKDFIKLLKSSKVVSEMIAERKSAASIRNYIVSTKFKNISGNHDLTSKQLAAITDLLNEDHPKGVYKELNAEIRKMLGSSKKK